MTEPLQTPHNPDPDVIDAEAAAWLSLRDKGMTEEQTTDFMHWLQRDPRNAEAFASLDQVWRSLDPLSVLSEEGESPRPDRLAPRPKLPARRSSGYAWLGIAAALFLGFVAFGAYRWHQATVPTAETLVGGFQEIALPDGSVVQLNTDSAVRIRYTEKLRQIDLVRGEAHFSVAKNAERPFVVGVDNVAVRAVGTAFNVRRRPDSVEVLVTEGKVQVQDAKRGGSLLGVSSHGATPLLEAGEKALVPFSARSRDVSASTPAVVAPVAPAEVERSLAWQEHRLEFESTPLAEVVQEFNRYNAHKLVIEDPRLAARRFGGSFRVDAYEPFVQLLERSFGVEVRREGQRTLLRSIPRDATICP